MLETSGKDIGYATREHSVRNTFLFKSCFYSHVPVCVNVILRNTVFRKTVSVVNNCK